MFHIAWAFLSGAESNGVDQLIGASNTATCRGDGSNSYCLGVCTAAIVMV